MHFCWPGPCPCHGQESESLPRHSDSDTEDYKAWVGPMPLDEFLEVFMPEPSQTRPVIPKAYFDVRSHSEVVNEATHTSFIDLLHGDSSAGVPNLIPGLLAVDISSQSLQKLHTHVVFYKECLDISKDVTKSHSIELQLLSRKNDIPDPYDAKEIRPALRDLIRYASQAYDHPNPRLVSYFIFLGGPWVRFVRWDLSGLIVTERCNFRKDSQYLVDFLWRFAHMSDIERGWNDSRA